MKNMKALHYSGVYVQPEVEIVELHIEGVILNESDPEPELGGIARVITTELDDDE